MTARPLRIAICDDFREERWPSMDRVAATLHTQLRAHHAAAIDATCICPPFVRAATRVPLAGGSRAAFSADRFLNRFWRYPRYVERLVTGYDLFHIVDHSYAHLVHSLPPARTVVTCHDLDAFRSVLAPVDEKRSGAFRAKTREILSGLQRAARVICDTVSIRDELLTWGLIAQERLVVIPLGVDRVFFTSRDEAADRDAAWVAPMPADAVEILHVGTTAERKRIDVLIHVVAALSREMPDVRLTRVGEPLTPPQARLVRDAGLAERLTVVNDVDEVTLAALYRRAALVLQPSSREGFGLPVIESLAAGTPVIASDLAVLREVGGTAVEFCKAGDVDAWTAKAAALLHERRDAPLQWSVRRERGRDYARRFTWERFAADVAQVYVDVARESGLAAVDGIGHVEGAKDESERWRARA
jgi:glycosyltransferase involved in cell wall biosynthesis